MALRRAGYENWQRNIAIALGNTLRDAPVRVASEVQAALHNRLDNASEVVREHVVWALAQNATTGVAA